MDYIVETQFEGPGFVAVPNDVAQMPCLSPDALGVLVWLASLPKGYAMRRASLLKRFAIGKDKWQRIARDLAAVGALTVQKDQGPDGRWSTRYRVRWPDVSKRARPEAENPAPVADQPEPENPPKNGGKPAQTGRKTRLPIKKEIQETARRRAARPSVRPAAAGAHGRNAALGAVPSRVDGGKRQYQGPDGCWYKRPDCPEDAKAFEAWLISGRSGHAAQAAGRS